jgi:hypothetical protein
MHRIVTYIDENTKNQLDAIHTKTGKSLSKIVADFIETGCNLIELKEKTIEDKSQNKITELQNKTIEYLLRLMYLTSDMYRCVRNEKSKYESKNTEDVMEQITSNVTSYLNENMDKTQ